jgi:hypothetical protein
MNQWNEILEAIGQISLRVFTLILLFILMARILWQELKGVLPRKFISYLGNVELSRTINHR